MSSAEIDLDAYFGRIGYSGPRTATLETLQALHFRQPQAIAFENIDALLGRAAGLDPASLERKLIHGRRGGWCFEQNHLLAQVLRQLGFQVTGLGARVLWNAPEGAIRPRSHMLLQIELGGRTYIADVGFGGVTLTAPLELVTDVEQRTPHETYRLGRLDGDYLLQSQVRGSWKSLYRFDLHPQLMTDYEVINWYLAHHPQSHFTHSLIAALATADRRYALLNNRLSVHSLQGSSEQHTLTTVAELQQTLENIFGLRLPDDPALERTLARLVQATPA